MKRTPLEPRCYPVPCECGERVVWVQGLRHRDRGRQITHEKHLAEQAAS